MGCRIDNSRNQGTRAHVMKGQAAKEAYDSWQRWQLQVNGMDAIKRFILRFCDFSDDLRVSGQLQHLCHNLHMCAH
jgi:hypothetical protein